MASSWVPPYIKKRILKYAITYGGFIDTNTLDLDQLDIAFGKKSTVEFRDVDFVIKKLSTVLHLPERFELTKARIKCLRLTLPVDFYKSSIVVEIDGVEAHARFIQEDVIIKTNPKGASAQGRSHKSSRTRSPPPPTGDGDAGEDDHIPTTKELAKSFLTDEPPEERKELEAALKNQSQYLRESDMWSDDEEEDSGTGQGLTLPGFVTKIIQGMVDRLEVTVSKLDLQIDAAMSPEELSEMGRSAANPTVSVNLNIASVAVEGVTPNDPTAQNDTLEDDSARPGRRRIFLQQIIAKVISDPGLFAGLSRVPSSASPPSQSDASEQDRMMQSGTSGRDATYESQERSNIQSDLYSSSSESSVSSALQRNTVRESSRPHTTRDEDGSHLLASSVTSNSNNLDQDAYDYAAETTRLNESNPRATSGLVGNLEASNSSLPFYDDAHDNVHNLEQSGPEADIFRSSMRRVSDTRSQRSYSPSARSDDLAESRLFSHEEAESMYLSAMSEVPTGQRLHTQAPGGWSSSSDASGDAQDALPEKIKPKQLSSVLETQDEVGCETPRAESRAEILGSLPASSENTGLPSQAETPFDDQSQTSTDYENEQENAMRRASSERTFLSCDTISMWLPKDNLPEAEQPEETFDAEASRLRSGSVMLESSYHQGVPGSFSQYAESISTYKSRRPTVTHRERHRSPSPRKPAASERDKEHFHRPREPDGLDIVVGNVSGCVDFAVGRLLLSIVQQAVAVCNLSAASAARVQASSKTADEPKQPSPALNLTVKQLNIGLVERLLVGMWHKSESQDPDSELPFGGATTLLKAALLVTTIRVESSNDLSTSLNVRKFIVGFQDENVISFDSSSRMRTSIRDLRSPQDRDISITLQQTMTTRRIEVKTLPIQILLNMQKLDEALGCFGGLSGVLEMSNSVISTAPSGVSSPKARPRAVRFQSNDFPPAPELTMTNKVNVRMAGSTFTLAGKSCSAFLQTSAIKVTSRPTIVGVAIDQIKLDGPFSNFKDHPAPFAVELRNTSVTYLFTPQEEDLTNLVELITPSKDKYENDDDILLDTLLRQRKKGSVIRAAVGRINVNVSDLEGMKQFQDLGEEIAKLSRVAKYLPDDERPGILSLVSINDFRFDANVNPVIGAFSTQCEMIRIAHVGLPSLLALSIGSMAVIRNDDEELIHEVIRLPDGEQLPMIMVRFIGDEMEPTVKVKLFNFCLEYRVPTLMALMGLDERASAEDVEAAMMSSIATVTKMVPPASLQRQASDPPGDAFSNAKPMHVDLLLRDTAIGLNPRGNPAKALLLFASAKFVSSIPVKDDVKADLEIRRSYLMLVNDVDALSDTSVPSARNKLELDDRHIKDLSDQGYVSVTTIRAAKVSFAMTADNDGDKVMNVDLKNDLFVLEACADSTQTLMALFNDLKPPTPPSKEEQYRTKIVPVEDLLASFTGEDIPRPRGYADDLDADIDIPSPIPEEDLPAGFDFDASFYGSEVPPSEPDQPSPDDTRSPSRQERSPSPMQPKDTRIEGSTGSLHMYEEEGCEVGGGAVDRENLPLTFIENFVQVDFVPESGLRKWDSIKNRYVIESKTSKVTKIPLKIRVRDVHFIWNLFDGYDWTKTRNTITKAVQDVETKAEERRQQRRSAARDLEEEEEPVVGDFLFNSIWIEVPANRDPRELARQINHNVDDLVSETSYAPTVTTARHQSRPSMHRTKSRRLKLERSKHHKVTFELRGVSADVLVFQPGAEEIQNSINVWVRDLEIFDHVPSSTWGKFLTYMYDSGKRPEGSDMIHIEVMTVRPVPSLTASELVLKVKVAPLRLHVDQDTLDFITRFFEFKDSDFKAPSDPGAQPFIQRVEVRTVHLKLDYKPKKVDYAGLRSGRTTEFMNFVVLDGANITLRHAILYGVGRFDQLHDQLNNIWMPDVKRNQLPGVLAGLAPVRPLVDLGNGIRDLYVIPMREYRKDGRVFRSVQKGAFAFAKNTTSELARLGAKLAIGTQNVLQGAEGMLSASPSSNTADDEDWEEGGRPRSPGTNEVRAISHYANQPLGVLAGLRGAARGLERDMLYARDAIVAIPGEIMEAGTAGGAARAVARHAPTIILRPAIGATKAIGMTLLGAGNAIDKEGHRKIRDKYKPY
ncbi:hypothetical protein K402DRAFT_461948 [Aulographum hederae CBS 113979]|uniref:Autophagy-related protein 2 n=1 Tax=Aulographum hederae CBS 113979 TaxID=1176131 RepID=A0A6G1H658_9PEZI|nr:hypothetical protein K402DRAFT_461948 [Aulographum hederae CBS 113979]